MGCPDELTYWTADNVAECLPYDKHLPDDYPKGFDSGSLYVKLWSFIDAAKNPTPLGGDGSNGTVEEPAGQLDEDNDDKAPHWWGKLSSVEQTAIVAAYKAEYSVPDECGRCKGKGTEWNIDCGDQAASCRECDGSGYAS